MQREAMERAAEFHEKWETLTPEEKNNELEFTKCILNQLLNFYLATQERNCFLYSENCKKANCPRDMADPVGQSLQTAIEAIEECILD